MEDVSLVVDHNGNKLIHIITTISPVRVFDGFYWIDILKLSKSEVDGLKIKSKPKWQEIEC